MDIQNDTSRINAKRLKVMLTPSWLSGIVAVLAGIVITGGVILTFNLHHSQFSNILLHFENTSSQQNELTLPGNNPSGTDSSSLQNTWPLIAFWAMVGLVVYFVGEFFVKVIFNAADFREELSYVHMDRKGLVRDGLINLTVSIFGAIVWLAFIDLCLKKLLPKAIAYAHLCVTNISLENQLKYGAISFIIVLLCVHINVIFMRFVLRRPRIFTTVAYLDI